MKSEPDVWLVAGGGGALGTAFLQAMRQRYPDAQLLATWYRREPETNDSALTWYQMDLSDAKAVQAVAEAIPRLNGIINCSGLLHEDSLQPEKSVRQFDADWFMQSIAVNALGTMNLAHAFHKALKAGSGPFRHFACISAKVGSIEDNRLGGWYSYRASKACLNMLLKTLSLEWRHAIPDLVVSALHPGTVRTRLSEPFQGGRPHPDRFTPAESVSRMMAVLDQCTPESSGRFWSWDGSELPW